MDGVSGQRKFGQHGAVIVLSSLWMVAFLTLVALALNLFFLGTMLLQQRDAAEYVALAAVKLMTSPPAGTPCRSAGDYFQITSCIANRAGVAAAIPMFGARYSQIVSSGQLVPVSAACSSCAPGAQSDPQSQTSFSWCGFSAPSSGRGYIILGTYDAATKLFSPACPAQISSTSMPTAAFVHLKLKNTAGSTDLIMPFISLLGGTAGIQFNSRAIAYLDGDLILLAKDPMMS